MTRAGYRNMHRFLSRYSIETSSFPQERHPRRPGTARVAWTSSPNKWWRIFSAFSSRALSALFTWSNTTFGLPP